MSDPAKDVLGIVLHYHDIPDFQQDEILRALRVYFAEELTIEFSRPHETGQKNEKAQS